MFVLPETTPPQDLDRCELCGMVIGDYKWDKKTMKTKYKYPICIKCEGQIHYVDMGCFENIIMYQRCKLHFDACSDPMLKCDCDEKDPKCI